MELWNSMTRMMRKSLSPKSAVAATVVDSASSAALAVDTFSPEDKNEHNNNEVKSISPKSVAPTVVDSPVNAEGSCTFPPEDKTEEYCTPVSKEDAPIFHPDMSSPRGGGFISSTPERVRTRTQSPERKRTRTLSPIWTTNTPPYPAAAVTSPCGRNTSRSPTHRFEPTLAISPRMKDTSQSSMYNFDPNPNSTLSPCRNTSRSPRRRVSTSIVSPPRERTLSPCRSPPRPVSSRNQDADFPAKFVPTLGGVASYGSHAESPRSQASVRSDKTQVYEGGALPSSSPRAHDRVCAWRDDLSSFKKAADLEAARIIQAEQLAKEEMAERGEVVTAEADEEREREGMEEKEEVAADAATEPDVEREREDMEEKEEVAAEAGTEREKGEIAERGEVVAAEAATEPDEEREREELEESGKKTAAESAAEAEAEGEREKEKTEKRGEKTATGDKDEREDESGQMCDQNQSPNHVGSVLRPKQQQQQLQEKRPDKKRPRSEGLESPPSRERIPPFSPTLSEPLTLTQERLLEHNKSQTPRKSRRVGGKTAGARVGSDEGSDDNKPLMIIRMEKEQKTSGIQATNGVGEEMWDVGKEHNRQEGMNSRSPTNLPQPPSQPQVLSRSQLMKQKVMERARAKKNEAQKKDTGEENDEKNVDEATKGDDEMGSGKACGSGDVPNEQSTGENDDMAKDRKTDMETSFLELNRNIFGKTRKKDIGDIADVQVRPLPTGLYPYQIEGVHWMMKLYKMKIGGILADDMGLGKTVQVAAFLHAVKARAVLLVVPVSLIGNWESELTLWCPELRQFVLHGNRTSATGGGGVGSKHGPRMGSSGIHITSYETLGRQVSKQFQKFTVTPEPEDKKKLAQERRGIFDDEFEPWVDPFADDPKEIGESFPWDVVIYDESQKLKSPSTQTYKAAEKVESRMRILLSGTPIQNNLNDFWALMNLANPGELAENKKFRDRYTVPIERGLLRTATKFEVNMKDMLSEQLRSITEDYMLRRTKDEIKIMKDVTKSEAVIWLRPTETQTRIYKEVLEGREVKNALNATDAGKMDLGVFQAIGLLKKLCNQPLLCHPEVSDWGELLGKKEPLVPEEDLMHMQASAVVGNMVRKLPKTIEGLVEGSVKLQCLRVLLPQLVANGHRCVVFSESVRMCDLILYCVLKPLGLQCLTIDGSLPQRIREEKIQRFQNEPDFKIFLSTTGVGGVGLTLHGGDRVILVDPSWNPARDAQAVDRIFRIGQTRDVVAYRLIVSGMIEEKQFRLQVHKQAIAGTVLEAQSKVARYFSKHEFRAMFELSDPEELATKKRLEEKHGPGLEFQKLLEDDVGNPKEWEWFLGISDFSVLFSTLDEGMLDENNAEDAIDMKDVLEEVEQLSLQQADATRKYAEKNEEAENLAKESKNVEKNLQEVSKQGQDAKDLVQKLKTEERKQKNVLQGLLNDLKLVTIRRTKAVRNNDGAKKTLEQHTAGREQNEAKRKTAAESAIKLFNDLQDQMPFMHKDRFKAIKEELEWAELRASDTTNDEQATEAEEKLRDARAKLDNFVNNFIKISSTVKTYKAYQKTQKNCEHLTSEVARFDVLLEQDKIRVEKMEKELEEIEREKAELEEQRRIAEEKHAEITKLYEEAENKCLELTEDRKRLRNDLKGKKEAVLSRRKSLVVLKRSEKEMERLTNEKKEDIERIKAGGTRKRRKVSRLDSAVPSMGSCEKSDMASLSPSPLDAGSQSAGQMDLESSMCSEE